MHIVEMYWVKLCTSRNCSSTGNFIHTKVVKIQKQSIYSIFYSPVKVYFKLYSSLRSTPQSKNSYS